VVSSNQPHGAARMAHHFDPIVFVNGGSGRHPAEVCSSVVAKGSAHQNNSRHCRHHAVSATNGSALVVKFVFATTYLLATLDDGFSYMSLTLTMPS
jgi:hypothetical protein